MTPDLQAVVNRLDALERELRRTKRVGWGMSGICGLIILTIACGQRAWLPGGRDARDAGPVWHMNPVRTVEAERFILRDGFGKMRAKWDTLGGPTLLEFYDSDGAVRARLTSSKWDSGFGLYSPGGRVGLESSREVSYLDLFDQNDTARATIWFRSPGGPSYLEGPYPPPSYLTLFDEHGKTLFMAP